MNILKKTLFKLKNPISICVLLIMAAVIWSQIYLDSQNYLLTNSNWYSFKSKMVDNFVIGFETAMSRNTLGGHEIDLRGQSNADIILHQKKVHLKELSFSFIIPNNSYLDVLYNFNNGKSFFFRLSKSSLYDSGFYGINFYGKYTQFVKADFKVKSNKKYHGVLRQTDQGIVFLVDNHLIAKLDGQKIDYGEFGFESGIIGAIISEITALDSTNNIIDTTLSRKTNQIKIISLNLVIMSLLILLVFFMSKKEWKTIERASMLSCLTGMLWLSFDYFHYSKIWTSWNYKTNTTMFTNSSDYEYDFESLRFTLVKGWAKILGESSISVDDYEATYGKIEPSQGINYCLNSKCEIRGESTQLKPSSLKVALLGKSALASVKTMEGETSTFIKMHQTIYKDYPNGLSVESINLSRAGLTFLEDGEEIITELLKDKVNVVIISLIIRHSSSTKELLAFEKFLRTCKENQIKTFLVNDPITPEKVLYLTDTQLNDVIEVVTSNRDKKNMVLKPWFEKFSNYNLSVLEPGEVFFDRKNIKRGKIWWDRAHLTSYGHELFGAWIGIKINNFLEEKS